MGGGGGCDHQWGRPRRRNADHLQQLISWPVPWEFLLVSILLAIPFLSPGANRYRLCVILLFSWRQSSWITSALWVAHKESQDGNYKKPTLPYGVMGPEWTKSFKFQRLKGEYSRPEWRWCLYKRDVAALPQMRARGGAILQKRKRDGNEVTGWQMRLMSQPRTTFTKSGCLPQESLKFWMPS